MFADGDIMLKYIVTLLLFTTFSYSQKASKYSDYPISSVDIRNVKLSDNFWLPKVKTIQKTTISYSFDKCSKEGRMENFLIAGGKMEGKVRGKMPFDDTDLYKIIEGASYSMISNPDPALDRYLDSIISIIKTGQEQDGYLTTWFTIDPLNPPANWVKPSKSRWENEISSHELYNSGHLFEAATAHYLATGKKNFLDIALKNADLLVDNFGPGKLMRVPGHQIIETGLVKLYRITQNSNYLELAKFFLDQRGNASGHELYGAYNQDHLPVTGQEEVVGHAVRGVYMYAGMSDIAVMYNDSDYLNAVKKLWENMIDKKLYITGGIGARHEGESFGDNYELPNLTAYSETCAAIGSVYWNHRLFLLTGDSKYYDVIERTLYNGLISGISLDGTKFFYPNPLESDGKYTFNMGACTRQPWFDCSCCPTNLIRFIPSVPNLIYATNKDTLYINLFISNDADCLVNKNKVSIRQNSDFPWDGNIGLTVNPEKSEKFTVKIRVPSWARNQVTPGALYSYIEKDSGKFDVKINGKKEKPVYKNGYVEINKTWKKGDKVEVNFPMSVHRVMTNKEVKSNQNLVALEYGPVVYCAEEIDNGDQISKMKINDKTKFSVEKRNNLLDGVNVITCSASDDKLVFVPYYSWSNRGIGKMKVWIPLEN